MDPSTGSGQAAGLTQVLNDGTNTYTYGLGCISQISTTTECFLGDALGSMRQLTNTAGEVIYAKSYDPQGYGVVTQSSGEGQSAYRYTGEQQSNDMVYLRARFYNPADGRFQSRDTWGGSSNSPMSYNKWNYVDGNPVNRTDHSGKCWYGDISTGEINTDPFLEGSGACSFFADAMGSIGADVSSPDAWLNSLPAAIRNLLTCKDEATLGQGTGVWMVIKYSTYSNWKFYTTTNTNYGAEVEAKFGVGGNVGYTCETSTNECSLTFGIAAGSAMFSVGLGGEYNVVDESFQMGATVDVGPCDVFLNYAEVSFTCKIFEFGVFAHEFELGWKRNPYEPYWVLAHSSQINDAGGYDEFGKRALAGISRTYPEIGLNYQIIETSGSKWDLEHKYKINLELPLIEY